MLGFSKPRNVASRHCHSFVCDTWRDSLPMLIWTTVLRMPYEFITERYVTRKQDRSPFVQQASPFQDIVIRCVRYAFAEIPATIGKVFFSKGVALPFFTFRKLRHGFFRSSLHWEEVKRVGNPETVDNSQLIAYSLHFKDCGSSWIHQKNRIS